MKQFFIFTAVLLCIVVTTNQVNAQLIICNSGHAELGVKPSPIDTDTATMLKVFGIYGEHAAGGRISFGDIPSTGYNVVVGERGINNTNQLWLHGAMGLYITKGAGTSDVDTLAVFDPDRSSSFNFATDLTTHGVFIQSDERLKENIEPIEDVLAALRVLEPVSYRLKSHRASAQPRLMSASNAREKEIMDRYYRDLENGSERYGFLAQNVMEAFPELVHTDRDGYMSIDYIGLIPILVQSINELRAELAEVKAERQNEEDPVLQAPTLAGQNELEARLNGAKLYQNTPNPWDSQTVIRYRLPQDVAKADIYIYDMEGKQLKCIPAQGRGESQVTLTANDLKAGMYLYALVADGALVDSKKMILTK